MQDIKVKEIKPVTSKSGKKFWVVMDEKGAEFTTFDEAIQQVTIGSLLAIEPKISGKYVNIESWEIKEETKETLSALPSNGKHYGKSPEELELSRRSFALSYAKDLAVAERIDVCDIAGVATDFYKWLKEGQRILPLTRPVSTLGINESEENPEPEAEESPKFKRDPGTIKSFGALYTACRDDFGLTRQQVWAELGVNMQEEIIQVPADCYRTIATPRSNNE